MWGEIVDFLKGDKEDFGLVEYFYNLINEVILKFFAETSIEVFRFIYNLMTAFLLKGTTIENLKKSVFDYGELLTFIQIISVTLLTLMITIEALERQCSGLITDKNRSISIIVGRSIMAGAAIYFVPGVLFEMLLKMNNALILGFSAIIKINGTMTINNEIIKSNLKLSDGFTCPSMFVGFALIVLVIAFAILAIHAAIRYIELIIAVIVSPLICATLVRGGDMFNTWLKETIAIVFTQAVHLLLLRIAMKIIIDDNGGLTQLLNLDTGTAFTKYISVLGILIVAIRGPKILKQFLYSSGSGGGFLGSAVIGAKIAKKRLVGR